MASTEHESGSCVGASDGESVGANDDDGPREGASDGASVGLLVFRAGVGASVVGRFDGAVVTATVGALDVGRFVVGRFVVGNAVGNDGDVVGSAVGDNVPGVSGMHPLGYASGIIATCLSARDSVRTTSGKSATTLRFSNVSKPVPRFGSAVSSPS